MNTVNAPSLSFSDTFEGQLNGPINFVSGQIYALDAGTPDIVGNRKFRLLADSDLYVLMTVPNGLGSVPTGGVRFRLSSPVSGDIVLSEGVVTRMELPDAPRIVTLSLSLVADVTFDLPEVAIGVRIFYIVMPKAN